MNLYTMLVNSLTYKKGSIAVLSIPATLGIELVTQSEDFFGISLGLILVLCFLIAVDFATGVIAAKVRKVKIESKLLAKTFYKCLMIYMFFWILHEINVDIASTIAEDKEKGVSNFVYSNSQAIISYIRTFILVLVTFREWLSIGENAEKMLGHKPYIFSISEKLFDVIERVFIRKAEEKLGKVEEQKKQK